MRTHTNHRTGDPEGADGDVKLFGTGILRHRYQLLKQACLGWDTIWEGISHTLISVYNACLSLGNHPALWKQAMVTVIPETDHPDYT